jgi:hypothetical protein
MTIFEETAYDSLIIIETTLSYMRPHKKIVEYVSQLRNKLLTKPHAALLPERSTLFWKTLPKVLISVFYFEESLWQ